MFSYWIKLDFCDDFSWNTHLQMVQTATERSIFVVSLLRKEQSLIAAIRCVGLTEEQGNVTWSCFSEGKEWTLSNGKEILELL